MLRIVPDVSNIVICPSSRELYKKKIKNTCLDSFQALHGGVSFQLPKAVSTNNGQ